VKRIATFAASLTGLAVSICPAAPADPSLSPEDANFGKYIAQAGITTEQWHAAGDRIVAGPGNFTKADARTIGQAGVNSYCRKYTQRSFT
jgi:hypothetical protein